MGEIEVRHSVPLLRAVRLLSSAKICGELRNDI